MPGKVLRGATPSTAAVWQDGLLLEKDGITPLLTKRGNGWAIGNQAASAWRMQGNTLFNPSYSSNPAAPAFSGLDRPAQLGS